MQLTRRAFGALSLGAAVARAATPKRRWEVYIVQHSHTDLGFTERQEIVADYHAQFVRQAIGLARSPKQQEREPSCKFKYTFEGFWQIEQFLSTATAKEGDALVEGIRSGLLELSASYLNLLDLADEGLLNRSVEFACDFARREQLPLNLAMLSDVNGASWGFAEALSQHGVVRLSTNINPDQGGYPFGKPLVPFFWETPSGKRLLVWNGLAYHKANLFGLMGGSIPAGDPGIPGLILPGMTGYVHVTDTSVAESKLLPFLAWLEESGYPYDFVLLLGSGTYTDNSPPGDTYCSILQEWNKKFGSTVAIRTATLKEFFNRLEKHSGAFQSFRGEWTDWWIDSAATAPNDTAIYRNALRNRRIIPLLDPQEKVVSQTELDNIDRKLLIYSEHTFGYSRTQFPSFLGEEVFARKSKVAVDADQMAGDAVNRLLKTRGEGLFTADQPFEYTVLNPHPFRRQELAALPINFWEAPFLKGGIAVLGPDEKPVAFQVEQSPRGWSVFVHADLPPAQSVRYRVISSSQPVDPTTGGESFFENQFYRIGWTLARGVVSLVAKSSGTELLKADSGGLGCPVYQIFPGADRSQAGAVSGPRTRPRDQVSFGRCVSIRRLAEGPLFEDHEFVYDVAGVTHYRFVLRCFRDLPQIEVNASIIKNEVDDPEGLFIYFPFAVPESRWVLDKPAAPIRPGLDQIPGTCCDYYSVLSGAAQVGSQEGLAWATLDAPLVQTGGLHLWRFTTSTEGMGPLYSWVTNNKWQTNTRFRTGGSYEMRYRIQTGPDLADLETAVERCRQIVSSLLVMRH